MTDKGKILAFPDTAAIEAEAAAWVARFDAGDVSARDQAAFQQWLNRSVLHRDAIAAYGSLWAEFDALRLLAGTGEAEQQISVRDSHPVLLERARPWLVACAASVIAVAGASLLFHPRPQETARAENHPVAALSQPPVHLSYETAVGHQKRITLADGSSVILNTNSRLDVNFSAKCRDVHLMRGEAYFEVVHNKTRPFTVYANN